MKAPIPKYEVNQELFFMKDNKVYKAYCFGIKISFGNNKMNKILYEMNCSGNYNESEVFPSKEELLKAL